MSILRACIMYALHVCLVPTESRRHASPGTRHTDGYEYGYLHAGKRTWVLYRNQKCSNF